METSIGDGETIKGDWGTFSEREGRGGGLKAERGQRGNPFYPEDDYSMAERQAGDKARAEANESQRKRTTRNQHSK